MTRSVGGSECTHVYVDGVDVISAVVAVVCHDVRPRALRCHDNKKKFLEMSKAQDKPGVLVSLASQRRVRLSGTVLKGQEAFVLTQLCLQERISGLGSHFLRSKLRRCEAPRGLCAGGRGSKGASPADTVNTLQNVHRLHQVKLSPTFGCFQLSVGDVFQIVPKHSDR